ncbi:MAG: hypothetical protein OEV49_04185 [candidate division Zixibacteria bacterium]|nr:hypothetical protein [candidate division Zixibacteria bacterium]MDH3936215.1 hypothetical protein [candidate division Zixibacteria bacterium]MDH4032994.1 hypothetical protein [candidate division Zixibacteria bacterium]
MLPKEQKQTYGAFYSAARNNDILPPETTLMIHLAAAMASGCGP